MLGIAPGWLHTRQTPYLLCCCSDPSAVVYLPLYLEFLLPLSYLALIIVMFCIMILILGGDFLHDWYLMSELRMSKLSLLGVKCLECRKKIF